MHQSVKIIDAIWLLEVVISSPLIHTCIGWPDSSWFQLRSQAWEANDLPTELSLPPLGSSINSSLILAAWHHGKLCGNHRNYAAVRPRNSNWHKSLVVHRGKPFCRKNFFSDLWCQVLWVICKEFQNIFSLGLTSPVGYILLCAGVHMSENICCLFCLNSL